MHPLVKKFEAKQMEALKEKAVKDNFRVGDTLRIKNVIEEKGKKWTQTSEGICIKKVNKGITSSFTIRRVDKDAAILLTFPFFSEGVTTEIIARGKVRRAKLYYLQRCSGKKGRLKALSHEQVKKLNQRNEEANG